MFAIFDIYIFFTRSGVFAYLCTLNMIHLSIFFRKSKRRVWLVSDCLKLL